MEQKSKILIKVSNIGSTAVFIADQLMSVNRASIFDISPMCPKCSKPGSYRGGGVYLCHTCMEEF